MFLLNCNNILESLDFLTVSKMNFAIFINRGLFYRSIIKFLIYSNRSIICDKTPGKCKI